MPALQYQALWAIPNAGPSVTTLHFNGVLQNDVAADIAAVVRNFFDSLKSWLPNDVTVTFDSEVTSYDPSTGTLNGATPVVPPAAVVGTAASTWIAGAGVRITWETGVIRLGRRVRGATFMVPAAAGLFDASGQVNSATVTGGNSAGASLIAASLVAGAPLSVWSRPIPGRPGALSEVRSPATKAVPGTLRGRKY